MIVPATITDVDFLPSYGIKDSIFIIWAKPEIGGEIIIEEFGSKKELIKKFDFRYSGKEGYDLSRIIGRNCEISIARKENRFIKFI